MVREKDRAKFIELAEKRVRRALKDIRLIGNLSNKGNYSYSDSDVRKIIQVLNKELRDLERRFESSGWANDIDFRLEE